jgi:hypothetical protein
MLRIRTGPTQRERVLELGSDGIRYGLQRFRVISLRSAAVHCVPGTVYQPRRVSCSFATAWQATQDFRLLRTAGKEAG